MIGKINDFSGFVSETMYNLIRIKRFCIQDMDVHEG